MREFWMIWNEEGWQPRVKHDSEGAAVSEAERLAKKNPGKRFVVLKAIAACETVKPVVWHKAERAIDDPTSPDWIPF